MTIRLIGALLIIAGCGSFGFLSAAAHKRHVSCLKQLISVLEYIECELQYRLTPLPELCYKAASICSGDLRCIFILLAKELEEQISPDAVSCMELAISKARDMPGYITQAMKMLGQSLGNFGLEGQLKGIQSVRMQCGSNLESLTSNQEFRLRGYQTLGLCAGAALAILLV